MARLEAQSRLLYYPTPNLVAELAATWFKAKGPVRLADPCCGTGEALRRFANGFGMTHPVETWGVELSYTRAEEAKAVLDHVLPTSFYLLTAGKWNSASVGLMFNNPPYDWSAHIEIDQKGNQKHIRHEHLFVEGATRKLVVGGHQVIILPRSILGNEEICGRGQRERFARHVSGWYETVKIYRFPDGEYERFKQVVVLALGKRQQYVAPGKEAIEVICTLAHEEMEIPILEAGHSEYTVPPAPEKARFTYTPIEAADLINAANTCSPVKTDEYQRTTYVRPLGAAFQPLTPISLGHMTMLITGQETGVLNIRHNGQPTLVKGMSRKVATQSATPNVDEKGKEKSVTVTERERHEATLSLIGQDGGLEMLSDGKSVGDFVTAHAAEIAEAIELKNSPLYANRPTIQEWTVTGKVALGLPLLPNRQEKGLFHHQRHTAIAASRSMKTYGTAILNCDMGYGKSASSIAALELVDEWPVLYMVPGHMVWKWQRDLERASNPDDPIKARVITRPVLGELPQQWTRIFKAIADLNGEIISNTREQLYPVSTADTGLRRKLEIRCTPANAGALAAWFKRSLTFKGKEKDGENTTVVTISPITRFTKDGLAVEYVDRDNYTLFDFVADYRTGKLGRKAAAVVAFDPAKYDAGLVEAFNHCRRPIRTEEGEYTAVNQHGCPTCGHGYPVGGAPHFCTHVITEKVLVEGEVQERQRVCGAPLFEMSRWRRVGLAQLVKRKFKHFFKVYVSDESHVAANGRTDIGTADQRLISSTRYNLALTGTLFAGTAGSLFYLLYRRSPEIRRLYGFDELTRWVDHYGLWERGWTQNEPREGEYGASTGIRRWNYREKELPGIAPAVIRYLLPITIFANLTDLGYELPPVHETVETLVMPDDLARQYNYIEKNVLKQVLSMIFENGDAGGLSAWFTACRFRTASAFRYETIQYQGKHGGGLYVELPEVTGAELRWLPKEERLAEIVRQNMAQGRKTLVFVEQSANRDIRPRLKHAIEQLNPEHVPSVGILSADDLSPAKREAWIKNNAPGLDVLVVNPKLVETGLDLVMFTDIVFYETTVSLTVLWQAMRRVWRLGQDKEVFVTFLSYANTIEEAILQRMGAKKKAAQLLYGKSASGVLVETDSEDVQREILKAAIEGRSFRLEGAGQPENLFTDGTERCVAVSTALTGSLVAVSPSLQVVQRVAQESKVAVAQLSMFGEAVQVQLRKRK